MRELDLAFQGMSTTVTIFLFSAVNSSHLLSRCLSCAWSSGLREWAPTQDLPGILNLSLLLPHSPRRTPEVPQYDITVILPRDLGAFIGNYHTVMKGIRVQIPDLFSSNFSHSFMSGSVA